MRLLRFHIGLGHSRPNTEARKGKGVTMLYRDATRQGVDWRLTRYFAEAEYDSQLVGEALHVAREVINGQRPADMHVASKDRRPPFGAWDARIDLRTNNPTVYGIEVTVDGPCYSVGVMIRHCATGQVPGNSGDPTGMRREIVTYTCPCTWKPSDRLLWQTTMPTCDLLRDIVETGSCIFTSANIGIGWYGRVDRSGKKIWRWLGDNFPESQMYSVDRVAKIISSIVTNSAVERYGYLDSCLHRCDPRDAWLLRMLKLYNLKEDREKLAIT